ncbi:hypothetical protein ACFQ46_24030 [Kineococcus sp. GCM10028916]|uniref:mannitol dehydrogenase family protein n=1 Tax=Kineococcus sp. GCM10028916 TaxID=3273394 RepID=UPI0036433AD9
MSTSTDPSDLTRPAVTRPAVTRPDLTGTPPRSVPFDRDLLTPSVVHLGTHGLRRAHHAVYFDELARRRISDDWGLVRVELQPPGARTLHLDHLQEHRVLVTGSAATSTREVEVLVDHVTRTDDSGSVLDALAAPTTRLVVLQVAGGETSPPPGTAPSLPAVAHGYLVRALARRRDTGLPPFTVLNCDPSPGNGHRTREAVLTLARAEDPGLAAWIEERAAFPCSVLDPLLSGTGGCPGWVVQDEFCDGRPPLEQVGARFVASTAPHGVLRTRLLDGARYAVSAVARRTGAARTDEALADPRVSAFLGGFLQEVATLLLDVPGIDLDAYRSAVLARLADPRTGEPLAPAGRHGGGGFAAAVLPSLRLARDQHRPRRHLVLAVAAWLSSLPGAGSDAGSLLDGHRDLLGTLADDTHLAAELQEALELLASGAFDPSRRDTTRGARP